MYDNNILNFQESTTILNACIKKVWKLIKGTSYILQIEICLYVAQGYMDEAPNETRFHL